MILINSFDTCESTPLRGEFDIEYFKGAFKKCVYLGKVDVSYEMEEFFRILYFFVLIQFI